MNSFIKEIDSFDCAGLLLQVGSADALAFFLPGIVSNLSKVLHGAKTMTSGAAGSMEAIDLAIRGLAEFLMIVLRDDANASVLDMEVSASSDLNECKSSLSLLEELRHLQVKDSVKTKVVEDRSIESDNISCSETQLQGMGSTVPSGETLSLHVTRTKDWIQKTLAHVNKLLSATFPHVRSYRWLITLVSLDIFQPSECFIPSTLSVYFNTST